MAPHSSLLTPNATPPRIAVVGTGYWGKHLVRNFHDLGALKLICESNETLIDHFTTQYPGLESCVAFNDVLLRDDIDSVVIATPAETHFALVREALAAGKHVYVEKPMALYEDEAAELITLADENSIILMVGHIMQYHPLFCHLRDIARRGELGRINYIYSHRLNLGKIRREENALWSFAPHDISMILSLAGERAESVFATGANYLHKQIADVTTTHLEFPSGLSAHIFVSWLHPVKEQRLVVVGDRKMAVFDDTLSWADKLLLYPHQIIWHDNVPIPDKAEAERIAIPQAEPLRLECEHFLHCISSGEGPLTDGREGARVLRVLNAAQRSIDNNGARIQLTGISGADAAGETARFYAHPSSIIDQGCDIGTGTKIWHFSHVLTGSRIGKNCNIGQNVVIGPDVSIGSDCKIQNNVSVYKGVTLEDGVFCGPSMVFTNIYNPRAEISKMDQVRPTLVRKGATLGANCTIVCGVTIGTYALVGAGAVINRNVPAHAVVVGNSAKPIGWVCRCGERLTKDLECLACKKTYEKTAEGLKEV